MKFQLCLLVSMMLSVKADFPGDFLFGKPNTPPSTSTDRHNPQSQETTIASELNNTSSTFSPTVPPAEDAHINRFGSGSGGANHGNEGDSWNRNKRNVRGELFPVPSTSASSTVQADNVTSDASPSTPPSITVGPSFGVGNRHRRELPTKSTPKPSTTVRTTPIPFGHHPIVVNNTDSATVKPVSTSTSTPITSFPIRHRRDLPPVTASPWPTISTESTERDSRFFFTFPTRNPSDGATVTRRTIFNRNRRQTLFPSLGIEETTSSTTRFPQFGHQEATAAGQPATTKQPFIFGHGLGEPQMNKVSTTAQSVDNEQSTTEEVTTRRFGFNRFRRSSHEFFPEEEEEQNTHNPTPTTKKSLPGRFRRDEDEDEKKDESGESFRRTTTTEFDPFQSTSTIRSRPFNFNFGPSRDEFPTQQPTTSTTDRIGTIRFRRSDNFDFGSGTSRTTTTLRPTTISTASHSSSTKEPTTSTRHSIGHFNI
ncbi:hypothetical protein CHUAL_012331 [Chamberlinius hualienensis]